MAENRQARTNRTKTHKLNPQFDSTTIPGIKKTNDYFLHALARGEIDGRNVGAANGLIHNQIQILQIEYSAEKLKEMERLLEKAEETAKSTMQTTLRLGELVTVELLSLLPENLRLPVIEAIRARRKELREQAATMSPEAFRYVLEREAERLQEIMAIENKQTRKLVFDYYDRHGALDSDTPKPPKSQTFGDSVQSQAA